MTCFEIQTTKEAEGLEVKKVSKMRIMLGAIFFIALTVIPAFASIDSDMTNFSLIIGNQTSGLTGFTVSMIGVFMQPPLLYFVVMGIFITIIGIVAGLLMRRGRRR